LNPTNPIKKRAKDQSEDPLTLDKEEVNRIFLFKAHAHLLPKLKFLLLNMTSVGILRLDAAQAGRHAFIGALDLQIAFARK